MKRALITLTIAAAVAALSHAKTPRTKVCNFDGENRTKVYEVAAAVGIGTAFQLPEGWEIQDFVVSDAKFFFGQSNGKIGVVKPLAEGKETSVIVFTTNEKLFTFHLSTKPAEEVDEMVIIDVHDETFFRQKVAREASKLVRERLQSMEAVKEKEKDAEVDRTQKDVLQAANTAYAMEGNPFAVDKVVDDGTFTYIWLPRCQAKPGVFVAKKDSPKELEPVKYVDLGDHFQVHRVIQGKEKLFLKSGETVCEIRRK
ncbi:MAG: TrbG/VirB9 family P-type conjugative transfer protein [Acidobacteria bacterium]|nr:TrbG/VirB9 family P-type conjugative transfer protein [Acidobacteriota bacterium]